MRAVLMVITLLAYGIMPPVPARAATIAWTVCPEDAKVQCGELKVPADWAKPAGPTITLTMARRPATDPAHRIGVLLVNPGGPGGSAYDFTIGATGFFGEELRKRFDIVGVDPRGVGRSAPVLCSRDLLDAKPSPLVETEQQYAAMVTFNRKLAADCAARTGAHFGHVDTGSVVRDFDSVRAALGEQKINFYGASYGTLIGLQYAERYPSRLRGLVLDSVMDHSADLDTFLTRETDAAQNAFGEFVKWCDSNKRCVLRGQDLLKLWASAMVKARAGQMRNPYDPSLKLSLSDLLTAAFTAFYEPQWYSFAYYLRDATAPVAAKRRRAAPPAADLVDYSFSPVICEDWNLRVSGFPALQWRMRTLAARAPQMLVSPLALSALTGCVGWPSPPDNPQAVVTPPPGLGPILLVNSRHDPATAYAWAHNVAAQLGSPTSLLTYDGWGHVAYNKSPCVSGVVDKYLLKLRPVAPGAHCPPENPEPFGVG
ncbi:alpha/beta hydrolase [Paractinoplanes lichenicola]|uniref:Alpha/beta fold hydrolase n=1 Tax=Paractinoplanes lichenicola TaxID=2802976 RepID=A0ABS1VI53_9ACTN|nr:alpha/beta hydrolase [Actinoplanes lichenicola]MBL7254393.1 alpha/beta fold hydrolase [Actinoplanes lichenicola]